LYPLFPTHCGHLLRPGQKKKRKSSKLPSKETEKKSRAHLVAQQYCRYCRFHPAWCSPFPPPPWGRKNKEEQLTEGMHRTEVRSKT
jgi:hypothetical protein